MKRAFRLLLNNKPVRALVLTNLIFCSVWIFGWAFRSNTITIDVHNHEYSVFLNGKLVDHIEDHSFSSGGVRAVVHPRLFPFDTPIKPHLQSLFVEGESGSLFHSNNVMGTGFHSDWMNYRATLSVSGMPQLSVIVHEQENGDGMMLVLRPFVDNDYGLKKIVDHQETLLTGHTNFDLGIRQSLSMLALLITQSYPWALSVLIITTLIHRVLRRPAGARIARLERWSNRFCGFCEFFLIIGTFLFLVYISLALLGGVPHVPDAAIYLMQAKIFASGHLFASPPIFTHFYDFFDSLRGGMLYVNGKWFSQYPFGHPFLLSLGVFFGMPWLIPPLVGVLELLMISLTAKRLFGKSVAILVLVVAALSPFFQSQAVDYMSHSTAALYLLGFLYFFFRTLKEKSLINPLLASVFWGLLFNTRILPAVGVAIPFAIAGAVARISARKTLVFFFGATTFVLLYLGYNAILTGHPFLNPYQLTVTPPLGFSSSHTIGSALIDAVTNFSMFLTFSFGWPQVATLLFGTIALLLPPLALPELLFAGSIFALMVSWLWFNGTYIMYGPRYYYEMMPFFFLLAGIGIQKLIRIFRDQIAVHFIQLVCVLFIGALSIRFLNSWVFKAKPLWSLVNTPSSIQEFKNFNDVNTRLIDETVRRGIHGALIFVKPCSQWWCDAIPVSLNSPNFDGDIVWAKDLGPRDGELLSQFQGRNYYHADYDTASVWPFSAEELPSGKK